MFLLQVARRFTKGLQDLVNQAAAEADAGGLLIIFNLAFIGVICKKHVGEDHIYIYECSYTYIYVCIIYRSINRDLTIKQHEF